MNDMSKIIQKERETLSELIDKTQKSLENAPEGTLNTDTSKGHVEYYQRLPGSKETRIYIPKANLQLARALAQKDYDKKVLKALNMRMNAIDKLQKGYSNEDITDIYERLSPERKSLVVPLIPTDNQFIALWLSKAFIPLAFKEDDAGGFYTENGERVRSKSEMIIADMLFHMDIPYKYECPIKLSGRVFYPDFTILDIKKRRTVFLEHFGMMDNMDYANDFIRKINFYETNGIFPGDNLIMTFESRQRPFDPRILKVVLGKMLEIGA